MRYNWQNPEWPHFEYNLSNVQTILYQYAQEVSLLAGAVSQLPDASFTDLLIDLMVLESTKTSEIEGEILQADDVRSSIRLNLGLPHADMNVSDDRAKGIAELMLDARHTFNQPLTKDMLFRWHRMVMMDETSSVEEIGSWRKNSEAMQIIAGAIGREKVYYEAPPADQVEAEMERFLAWYNQTQSKGDPYLPGPVRAAIAHLYFESIHPFIDGNGRIGRAIAEKALSQDIGSPVLFSISSTIQSNRKEYYRMLNLCSGYSLEITEWIDFFVNILYKSQLESKNLILFILKKAKFWRDYASHINIRQEKVIHRMFEEGPSGFTGGISAKKYMSLTGCSKATATRDLADLLEKGILYKLPGEGPSTRYDIQY
ncbi:Fic family protein [Candidatus Paracaedibacter symbiosus]|uniref:Fic family protein n=1 Tax=Candidatus Paracaedibacter symbiosus TaxID=244582 RepID=UPI000509F375|nr:Fic family protein [Candidatus Paracaedibacter symbiosus]